MRNYIISKQTAKKGKKRKRKMTRALSSIKVRFEELHCIQRCPHFRELE